MYTEAPIAPGTRWRITSDGSGSWRTRILARILRHCGIETPCPLGEGISARRVTEW
jgi:hypothetical protein